MTPEMETEYSPPKPSLARSFSWALRSRFSAAVSAWLAAGIAVSSRATRAHAIVPLRESRGEDGGHAHGLAETPPAGAGQGRVVVSGAISQYNGTTRVPAPANCLSLRINRARMEGFRGSDYAEAYAEMDGRIRDRRPPWREDAVDGLVNAPQALLRLFDGTNTGKLLVRIRPQEDAGAA